MELNNVIEKVNNKTLAYYSALQKIYDIYKVNKDNSRVCDNLCTLIGMCIEEYVIPDKFGKSMVMNVLMISSTTRVQLIKQVHRF